MTCAPLSPFGLPQSGEIVQLARAPIDIICPLIDPGRLDRLAVNSC